MCTLIVYWTKPHYSGGLVATLPTDPWPSCAFVSASSYTGNTFAQHVAVNNLQTQTMEKLRASVENSLFICRYKAVWTHVIWFKRSYFVTNDSFPQSWTAWVDPYESLQYNVSGLCLSVSLVSFVSSALFDFICLCEGFGLSLRINSWMVYKLSANSQSLNSWIWS